MTLPPKSNPSEICQGILQYLHDHPEAADSLDGIASWWLPQSGHSVTVESVQAALVQLVEERQIARIDLADGRTLFQSIDKVSGSHPAWKPTSPRRRP
jgi:hypothetical protein